MVFVPFMGEAEAAQFVSSRLGELAGTGAAQ
jgi:hypothetical protein